MSSTRTSSTEILTTKQMYQRSIADLNKQLYEAYRRITTLQEELRQEVERFSWFSGRN